MPKEIRSQHDQRVSVNDNESGDFFTDQHGREWHAEVEIETQHPCSPLMPVGWEAPLDVPRNYITVLRGRRTRGIERENYDLRIEYDRWIADWKLSAKAWDEDARKLTIKLKGGDWDFKKQGIPEDVLLSMGARPSATLDAVRAAKQGHPYVLGIRPFDPSKPADVKLRNLLVPQATIEEPDWMADEVPVEAKRRGRRVAVAVGEE
jgi:hypothetical protein